MAKQDIVNYSIFCLAFFMCAYVFSGYILYRIGRKFDEKVSFPVFLVPIYNFVLMCRYGGVSPWNVLGLMIFPISIYSSTNIWGSIAEKLGKDYWLYGLSISFIGLPVFLLAFDKSTPVSAIPNIKDTDPEPEKNPEDTLKNVPRRRGEEPRGWFSMDALNYLKWGKKKKKGSATTDLSGAEGTEGMASATERSSTEEASLPGEEKDFPRMAEPITPGHTKKKLLPLSPVTIGIIIFLVALGAGTYYYNTSFRSGLKFTMNKKSAGSSLKNPGAAVGGIQFGDKKAEADLTVACQGKVGEEYDRCMGKSIIDPQGPPSVSPAAPPGAVSPPGGPAAPGPVTPPAASGATSVPQTAANIPTESNPPAAPHHTPPTHQSVAPQAVATSPGQAPAGSPGGPAAPGPSTPSGAVSPAPSGNVVTAPVKERELPVPIQLALKDSTPFREKFEHRYAEKIKDKKSKDKGSEQPAKPGIRTAGTVDIKDIMGDNKNIAPNVAPGAGLDILGGGTIASTTVYGVMISGSKKTAVTSNGEVSIGGKIDGEPVVDITAEGVKLKSGRVIQISSNK